MWRPIAGLFLACAVGAAVPAIGAAASISLSADGVGAGSASASRCSTAGVSVLQNLTSGLIVSISVSGIDPACAGAQLDVGIASGASFSTASSIVPPAGGNLTVTLAAPVPVSASVSTDILLVGP